MKKIKLFFMNLGLSLLSYIVIVFLGFWLFSATSDIEIPGEIMPWFTTLISTTLLFLLGTKLNLLGKHWLNYLSVCGALLIALPLAIQPTYISVFLVFPFPGILALFMREDSHNFTMVLIIAALLPSLITWSGMVYQSRRNKNV